jgi:hypothetical protein
VPCSSLVSHAQDNTEDAVTASRAGALVANRYADVTAVVAGVTAGSGRGSRLQSRKLLQADRQITTFRKDTTACIKR